VPRSKTDLITFKVEPSLAKLINRMQNKSEFIRQSILSSLQSTCPLCQGTGVLTVSQRDHWKQFSAHHTVRRCPKCDAVHLSCDAEPRHAVRAKGPDA
jgi:hypothetical protein